MIVNPKGWIDLPVWKSTTWRDIQEHLSTEEKYYPGPKRMFRALYETPLKSVRAVILGQDPYHNGQANGLAFSVHSFVKDWPPSLSNIIREYCTDTGNQKPYTGDLTPWAREGVLLLNTYLTVRPGAPLSHSSIGWQALTKQVCQAVLNTRPNTVFILWGKHAKDVGSQLPIINKVESVHPSPLAAHAGFFGSRPFTKANALLAQNSDYGTINWRLPTDHARS